MNLTILKRFFPVVLLTGLLISCSLKKDKTVMESPDGNLEILVESNERGLHLQQLFGKDSVLTIEQLGIQGSGFDLKKGYAIKEVSQISFDETWKTVNGKFKEIRNNYNQYVITLDSGKKGSFKIVFRLFDDGYAYKYIVESPSEEVEITGETTQIKFSNNPTYWAYNGEFPNIGPKKLSEEKVDSLMTPAVLNVNDSVYVAIHEAEVLEYAPFNLSVNDSNETVGFHSVYAKNKEEVETSWRVFLLGKHPGDLVESNILVNLNDPSKIEDTSWIKPGKSMWDWRVWGYTTDDGYTYGLNTDSHKRLIDFASENNVQYLLIDADWYGAEFSDTSDPTNAREGINIEECMAYAKDKNVGVILYLNDKGAKKFGLERVLSQFSAWGAAGVKYGFMKGTEAEKVIQTRKVIEMCAKYKLMVDFHDSPIKPSGDRRTWPNMVTKEYCHAQADGHRSYMPGTMVSSAFINTIAGPLDYTNGWFDLNNAHSRNKVFEEIPGTVAAEVAKNIVVYTGWMILPDAPEAYLKKKDLFECIKKMPAQFDSLDVLQGSINDYIVVARKAGNDWFVGSITNEEAREITIDFDFLPENKTYKATIYGDAESTHYLNEKETYKITEQQVNAASKITVKLAPGGGNAIHLEEL
ncbi:glycoside hydrolase family 97 protein [Galbibacter mesophilus]|uniref:glycoside hydrolase family 97 protein n=1 Tax=Galbibacter mesophilus TaxID=379069 RepID=UPI00191D00D5|nr:glycoside hydrolase family 97 protein [Galbibacter mesophilus]MCM5663900.1 glycoside hydrolase family 97 protein [Galbibacter mesophilus]